MQPTHYLCGIGEYLSRQSDSKTLLCDVSLIGAYCVDPDVVAWDTLPCRLQETSQIGSNSQSLDLDKDLKARSSNSPDIRQSCVLIFAKNCVLQGTPDKATIAYFVDLQMSNGALCGRQRMVCVRYHNRES